MAESRKTKTVKAPPLPDAVDNQGWKVQESVFGTGSVDHRSKVISVPLTADPDGRMTRNHEMLHLKFSPKSPPRLPEGVDPMVYQACEDMRINLRGERLGIVQDQARLTESDLGKWRAGWKDKPQVAAAALAASWTNREDRAAVEASIMDDFDEGDAYEIRSAVWYACTPLIRRKAPGPKVAITAAQTLSQILTPPPPVPKEDGAGDGKSGPDGAEMAKDIKKGIDTLGDRMYSGRDTIRKARQMIQKEEYAHGSLPDVVKIPGATWGEMTIRRMPRPLLFPARMKSRRWKPTDQGSVFRYPQRWAADMSGFAFKGIKEGGCTLLIDVSGSMCLDEGQILQIMQMMPASLIATYSGSGRRGELRIIAEKGRRAVERDFRYSGGNVIDGPALRWLAKQQGPRYWVSDGGVTGIGDGGSPVALIAECIAICERYHIARIGSVDEVIEKFKHYRLK